MKIQGKKRQKKQSGRYSAMLAGMLILLAAVSGQACAADLDDAEMSVELNYYIWEDEKVYSQKVIDAFSLICPNIKVNLCILKNSEYDVEISELVQSGAKADLIGIRGVEKILSYQNDGILLELNDQLNRSGLDMTSYGNMVYSYVSDNKYYGLPTRSTYWVLYYNKSLFDEAGYEYPGQLTWEEYAQLAKELTYEKEDGQKVWGGYFVDWCPFFAGIQRQNYLYDDDISKTMESLLMLNRFYNEDKSHAPIEQVIEIENDYLDVFWNEEAAMMPQGEWLANMILEREKQEDTKLEWDIAPMPVFDGMEDHTTWGQYQFAGITSTCEYPEEAFRFLTYLCGEEGAKIYAASGIISGYINEEIISIYQESLPGKNTNVFFESQRIQEIPLVEEYSVLLEAYKEIAQKYLLGEISFEEANKQMEQVRQRVYGQ